MSVIKNYTFNLLYQITALIVPFIMIPYISRVFGAEGVGMYAVSYSIALYFCLFGLLGINTYGTRQIAYCRDDFAKCRKTFWNLNYMRFLTMGMSIVVFLLFVNYGVENEKKVLFFCQSFVLWASFFDISWYYAGMEEFKITAIRNIIVKIVGMLLVFIFVRTAYDVWKYALIISMTLLIGQIVMWKTAIKRMSITKPERWIIMKFMAGAFKLWIPAVAINVYTSLDKVMLGYMTCDSEAGYYENSQHMIRLVSTITTTLGMVLTPKMSNLFANKNMASLKDGVCKSFTFVTLLAFPLVFGILAVRKTFVPWFFGDGFDVVSDLLIVSAWLVLTLSWSNIVGNQILIACGRERYYTLAVSIAAILNILFNLVLIPQLLCMGAILSSVIAEYVGMVIMVYYSKDVVSLSLLFKGINKYLIAGVIMYIPTYYIGEFLGYTMVSTIIQIVVAVMIYSIIVCFVYKDKFIIETLIPYFTKNSNLNIFKKL